MKNIRYTIPWDQQFGDAANLQRNYSKKRSTSD